MMASLQTQAFLIAASQDESDMAVAVDENLPSTSTGAKGTGTKGKKAAKK